ncbi:MAG: TonB-dependent receptor [Terracidiphilus sp.]
MGGFHFPACRRGKIAARFLLACFLAAAASDLLSAQSTFGTILGTVSDLSGALVVGAPVTLIATGTAATRTVQTDNSGSFAFKNLDIDKYALTITAPGFQLASLTEITLTARETRRLDVVLKPSGGTQTVEVVDNALAVISTEVSNLAETKIGDELVELPVAIYSRSSGSTSPISTLTTEAGVQTDDGGNLAVMGTTAALLSVTIDGISSVGVEYSGPVNEMFPSFNSIEEIRVSESNNNAEFSGVADITTVSKAGTLRFHGGAFENNENTVFNSNNTFALTKPRIIMNDFGGTLGGPLSIPHLNLGKSFFFASYEGLRLPRETPMLLSVPSADMRSGNIASYLNQTYCTPNTTNPNPCPNGFTVYNPDGSPLTSILTNTALDNTVVPVNPISTQLLTALMPMPNYGDPSAISNNYQINFPSPISSNQGDIRFDHIFSDKQSVFARYSYKNRQVMTAPMASCTFSYCAEAGSPLQGGYNTPEIDEGMTFAHNYVLSTALLNEFRGGFNAQHTSETQGYSTSALLGQTGLTVPQPDLQWAEAPQVLITGFMSTGAGNPGMQRGQIFEALDNVTWTRRKHTFKFGADFKYLADHDENVYGNYRSGWYVFDGSSDVSAAIAGGKISGCLYYDSINQVWVNNCTLNAPYADFLLSAPDYTEVSSTNNPIMNGRGKTFALFAQDDWKITPRLTLNLGLRYELHPPMADTGYNTATFDPNALTNGVAGAVVAPNTQALSFTSSALAAATTPTPIITAAQDGIPGSLRFTDKTDWGPRLGFAWRVLGNDKTVLRGGWGRYLETPLGFSLVSGWAAQASYLGTYNQDYASDLVTPLLSFANPFNGNGGANFDYAYPIHYKDPSVQQWNLTLERDLGKGFGARLSYTGSHGANLEAMVDLNQVPANTVGYTQASANRPFPLWGVIQSVVNAAESNYNSGTIEISRHSGRNLSLDASYIYTRDLSNAGGATPTAFAVSGGSFLTDRFHPRLDYGNVIYDRRQRFLASWLYQMPFGHGQRWLQKDGIENALISGWQLSGVTILQSGPFLTPYESSTDPAGTNILITETITRANIVPGQSLYASPRTASQWLNPSAFSIPTANGGVFGTAGVGSVVGPGTANLSLSLAKEFAFNAQRKFQFGVAAANVMNHRNYEPPNMQVDASGFGSISALQTAEGAGPRSLELSGRFSF